MTKQLAVIRGGGPLLETFSCLVLASVRKGVLSFIATD